MTDRCRQIQDRLAAEGQGALAADAEARSHVASCEACTSFVARLTELDFALGALPEPDAPDALVQKLLARKELAEPVPVSSTPQRAAGAWSPWLRLAVVAAALLVSTNLLFWRSATAPRQEPPSTAYNYAPNDRPVEESQREVDEVGRYYDRFQEGGAGAGGVEGGVPGGVIGGVGGGLPDAAPPAPSPPPPPPPPPPPAAEPPSRRPDVRLSSPRAQTETELPLVAQDKRVYAELSLNDEDRIDSSRYRQLRKDDAGAFGFALEGEEGKKTQASAFEDADAKLKEEFERSGDALANRAADLQEPNLADREGARDRVGRRANANAPQSGLSSLTFQEASGYWSNTYVPGDPTLRFLDARLRVLGQSGAAQIRAPHDDVRRVSQPFDAPERNALAVYLAADRRAVTEPTRLTLQVGLQAMARQASRRPAMNVAVVLDRAATDLSIDHALIAFVRAMEEASEIGDTIRYVTAGAELEELEVDSTSVATLPEALANAITLVAGSEDPNTVLGANLVILVTGRNLGAEVSALENLAHKSAVGGVPVSAVAVGAATDADAIERIALAGQGSRRLLAQPSGAAAIVDAELTAASRVVGRAVRLRIRLMPGVQLVDVLGSRRLDAVEADRVREAEQAIDQRLARNLGIAADRGEDEEGIQIVIPGFYAGDSHVVLLDVVAQGPGPVADVTARYKDVGSLTNEVARASLALERGERSPTALEANVTKNVLAFHLSESLERAGEALTRGDANGAQATLSSIHESLRQALVERPQLDAPDVRADIELLNAYLTLLGTGVTANPTLSEFVSASLRFAARLKLTSRLALD